MTALNKTASLWSKRLPVFARESRKLTGAGGGVTPACCFVICNLCCWVAPC